jgi:hypothetical protein
MFAWLHTDYEAGRHNEPFRSTNPHWNDKAPMVILLFKLSIHYSKRRDDITDC